MNSFRTARFRQAFDQLPAEIQERARQAYRLFSQNPYHPSLQFKQVHPSQPIFSARITLDYRALGIRDGDEIVWFWIGSHAAYNNLVAQLKKR